MRQMSGGDAVCGGTSTAEAAELLPYLRCIQRGKLQHSQSQLANLGDIFLRTYIPPPFTWREEDQQRFRRAQSATTSSHLEEGGRQRGVLEIHRSTSCVGVQEETPGGTNTGADSDEIEDYW